MRHCAVEYDLLSLPFDEMPSTLTPVQNAVRLTLFIFGFATYTRFEPSSAYTQAMVDQLKEALELIDSPALLRSDLLSWTGFFGAHISRHTKERKWFITRLARTTGQLNLKSAGDLEAVLERFFYLENFSRASLLEIWDEVTSVSQASPGRDLADHASTDFTYLMKIPPSLKEISTPTPFLAWDPYPVRG